jgi:hypothetical protein
MNDTLSATLAPRALRAYERGRWRFAALHTAPAAGLAALAAATCDTPRAAATAAAALALAFAFSHWRGRSWARGARVGYAAGLLPCFVPTLLTHGYCAALCFNGPALCLGAGFLAGALVGWRGARGHADGRFWAAATAVLLAAGTIGCTAMGLAGLGGLALGVGLGVATPVLVARAA